MTYEDAAAACQDGGLLGQFDVLNVQVVRGCVVGQDRGIAGRNKLEGKMTHCGHSHTENNTNITVYSLFLMFFSFLKNTISIHALALKYKTMNDCC